MHLSTCSPHTEETKETRAGNGKGIQQQKSAITWKNMGSLYVVEIITKNQFYERR